jgi:hypothetical protein
MFLFSCNKETADAKYNVLECNILNDEGFTSEYFDANTKIVIKGNDTPYYADITIIVNLKNNDSRNIILYQSWQYDYLVDVDDFEYMVEDCGRLYVKIGSNFALKNDENSYYISKPDVSVTPINGEIKVLVDSSESIDLASITNGVNIENGLINKGIRFVEFNCCDEVDLSNIHLAKSLIIGKVELDESGTCDIDFKNIEISQEMNGFNSNNKKTIYTFISKNTQIYDVELTEGYTFKVFDNNGNIIDIDKEKLKYNNAYYIIVYANTTGTYNIKIDYPMVAGEINLLHGDVVYLRFNAPTKDVYYIGNKGDSGITFGFIDGNGIKDIKPIDKNETTLVKIINYSSDIKTFIPNIVEVSKSNVYNSYLVSKECDYSVNTSGYYYIYDGENLEKSNDKTPFFEEGVTIYSKYDFSIESMGYIFYALVNGKYVKNHGTYNELYYGDTLENIKLYIKYDNGNVEQVYYTPYVDNKEIELTDGIYKNVELSLKIYSIEINSDNPIFYIIPKPISFDYSIVGDNVYITTNNYNGKVNEVVFTVENDYRSDGTLRPHKKTLDSKSATLGRNELIAWANGNDVKLKIYLPINCDYNNLDNMLYNSSLEFDVYTDSNYEN